MCLHFADAFFFFSLFITHSTWAFTNSNNIPLNDHDFSTDVISHAFVQTGSELHYFRDISHQDAFLSSFNGNKPIDHAGLWMSSNNVKLFDKELTDFGKSALGVPVQRRVFVSNPTNSNIIFSAITSSSINFHYSFFDQKSLAPRKRTFFQVFFLPTLEHSAPQKEFIYIHTSIGIFAHQVQGVTNGNPYRIRSFYGVQLPLNATFSVPLRLHNPHPFTITISELFASDYNIRLDLHDDLTLLNKNGSVRRTTANWRLLPFEMKEFGMAKILGNIERNSTSFIVVKIWKEQHPSHLQTKVQLSPIKMQKILDLGTNGGRAELLMIAVQVQVIRSRSLFAGIDLLDFGLVHSGAHVDPLILTVYSSLERGVEIESIYAENQNRGVYLQFESKPPISIKCGAKGQPGLPLPVASLNIDTNLKDRRTGDIWGWEESGDGPIGVESNLSDRNPVNSELDSEMVVVRQGLVVAETRGGNYNVSVPFSAVVYRGNVRHNIESTAFHHQLVPIVRREIVITNHLPFGLAIWDVEIGENGKDSFEGSLTAPSAVILAPKQSLPAVMLNYLHKQPANFSTQLTLHTNLTTFSFPIIVFSGELKIHLYAYRQDEFNFGSVEWGEHRAILFTLFNPNPVSLKISRIETPFSDLISLNFIGMQNFIYDNQNEPFQRMKNWRLEGVGTWVKNFDFMLAAHSLALFKMSLSVPSNKFKLNITSNNFGPFHIETQFDSYNFLVKFEFINAHLESVPSKIIFRDAFSGSVLTHPVKLFSTFALPLHILTISIFDGDPRFRLISQPTFFDHQRIIPSKILTTFANITFVPDANCPENCYLGIELGTSDGQWFAYGMKLPQNLAEIDHYLFARLRQKWLTMGDQRVVRTHLRVDTDLVRGFEIPVEGHLVWPRLFSHTVVHFPLTAVGNFTIVNLTLSNPSTSSVIVQLLPLVIYPDPELLLDLFRAELPAPLTDPVEMNETLMFSLRDTELFTLRPGSPVPQLREEVEQVLGNSVPRFTQSLLLKPGMSTRIRIGFLPSDYSLHSSLLIIRNNLTALEPVVLYGRGARMNMDIDNKTARSLPLMFEIQPQHLADCANPRRQLHKLPTTLTVRRSFAVRNSGEVSFSVINISISNMPCENRGFRVLNCDRFRLEPNETTLLDIAYTPDFLLSTNEATLQLYMHMNGTPWAFDLVATIPPQLLSVCHAALPRPPFEGMMYYTCVLALTFCFICVVSCAYLEGDRVISCAYRQQFSIHCQDERTPFELVSLFARTPSALNIQQEKGAAMEEMFTSRNKQFFRVAPDDGPFSRLLWRSLNFTLLFFSYIWPLIRGNIQPILMTKSKNEGFPKPYLNTTSTTTDSELFERIESSDEIDDEQFGDKELDEIIGAERSDEEFTQHPKDPEQEQRQQPSKSKSMVSGRENVLNFSDPVLYQKLCSFLNSEGFTFGQRQHNSISDSTTSGSVQSKGMKESNNNSNQRTSDRMKSKDQRHLEERTSGMHVTEGKKVRQRTSKRQSGRAMDDEGEGEKKRGGKRTSQSESTEIEEDGRKEEEVLGGGTMDWEGMVVSRRKNGPHLGGGGQLLDRRTSNSSSSQMSSSKRSIGKGRNEEHPEWFQRLFERKSEKEQWNWIDNQTYRQQKQEAKQIHELRRRRLESQQNSELELGSRQSSSKSLFVDRIRPEEERNVLGSGEDVGELSDSSGVPEWVDQTPSDIITENIDEELGRLAEQSAALFSRFPKSGSSSSLSSLPSARDQLNLFKFDQNLTDADEIKHTSSSDTKSRIQAKYRADEETRIQSIIEKLTRDYREKLTNALVNSRKPSSGRHRLLDLEELHSPIRPMLKLTLPSDISANCEFEQNPRGSEENSGTSSARRERRSPGREFSARVKGLRKSEDGEAERRSSSPAPFLFNIGDPIWKPIGMLEQQQQQMDWPTKFNLTEKMDEGKKQK